MKFPDQKWMSWTVFFKTFPGLKKLSYGYFGDTYRKDNIVFKVVYNCKRSRDEIDITKLVTKLESPFLSKLHASYFCKKAHFFGDRNNGVFKCWKDWNKVKSGNGIILAMEYSGQSFKTYLKKHSLSRQMMLLMLYAIYTFRVKTKLHHNDTYLNNFTVKKIKKQDIFLNISKHVYELKNVEYIPVLLDYGKSEKKLTVRDETDISILMDNLFAYTELTWISDMYQFDNASKMIARHFSSFRMI